MNTPPNKSSAKKDFFISYTGANKIMAEWIAWVLEESEAKYSTIKYRYLNNQEIPPKSKPYEKKPKNLTSKFIEHSFQMPLPKMPEYFRQGTS